MKSLKPELDLELLKQAVMDSRDGITIADALAPDMPLIFVNPAFERMTGYTYEETVGHNCRFLRADNMPSAQRERLRYALKNGEGFLEVLPNKRRDGQEFWNELSLSPIRDASERVTHFLGFQKDVTDRISRDHQLRELNQDLETTRESLEEMATIDALTRVYNRRHFDDRLQTLWKISARVNDPLALFFIDIDNFKEYNDRFGHLAGDNALVTVAQTLAESFKRGSDFLARYGGEEFVVVACGMAWQPAANFAQELCARIRELRIEHPEATGGRLTISIGYTVVMPTIATPAESAVEEADQALYQAKNSGRDRAVGADTAHARQHEKEAGGRPI